MKIISSIFSYMKIFIDRFLDYLGKGILFYLLKSFLSSNLTQHLIFEFSSIDEKIKINLIGGDLETRNKIETIDRKIFDLQKARE